MTPPGRKSRKGVVSSDVGTVCECTRHNYKVRRLCLLTFGDKRVKGTFCLSVCLIGTFSPTVAVMRGWSLSSWLFNTEKEELNN